MSHLFDLITFLLWADGQAPRSAGRPQRHDISVQALRLGLAPVGDGTARGQQSGIELHLVPIPKSGWRLYAERPHEARVSVSTARMTVPASMVRSALQLVEYNRGKEGTDLSLD